MYVTEGKSKPYPVSDGYPKLITELLQGYPNNTNVDAALQTPQLYPCELTNKYMYA